VRVPTVVVTVVLIVVVMVVLVVVAVEENNYLFDAGSLRKIESLFLDNFDDRISISMPYIIGITGGSGSGKTTFSKKIKTLIENSQKRVFMISSDWFYRTKPKHVQKYNFDTPLAFDFTSLMVAIKENLTVMLPEYDYVNNARLPDRIEFNPGQYDVVIIEGIMLYNHEELRNLMNLKLFVHTDLDVCLARRLIRDINERGRSLNSVITQWFEYVKPGYEEFIYPTMNHADYVFNNTKESIEENIYNDNKLLKVIEVLLDNSS
jgi:uridine kinase